MRDSTPLEQFELVQTEVLHYKNDRHFRAEGKILTYETLYGNVYKAVAAQGYHSKGFKWRTDAVGWLDDRMGRLLLERDYGRST